ncbi:putative quinol monooxygenase [Epibacterium ulvae]|uniref:Antibiotic biosynthesis monooxygenase n=1 Tax=Epibacterium ulvae TaxID=1156985 RepID=A0A1G5Q1R7_9RHOB|nr:antibiotic biosynthesis monooxygenase family protein [Epibacterium ulvae]SCZ55835.1 Antibiotic biosynthesis monooxygenase [Epibacterium ulvae]
MVKEAAIISLFPVEEFFGELLTLIESMLDKTRTFEGCEQACLMRSDDPAEVVIFTLWSSAEAYQTYVDWRIESGGLLTVQGMIEQDIKIKSYQVVA